jgi:aminoglycoside phosphotransferase (APT) family kinase protein
VSLGQPLATGRTAEIYPWGEGQVLKLFHAGAPASWVDYEAGVARTVQAIGLPVPAVGGIVTVASRIGILYSRIVAVRYGILYGRVDGISMGQDLRDNPRRFFRHARLLAELHAAMHTKPAPGLPPQRQRLQRMIKNAVPLPDRLKRSALAALDKLPEGDRLCHGDFHPDNILLAASGPVIIDWTDATCGNPLADVARTLLLLQVVVLPPATPHRRLLLVGLHVYRWYYLRCYLQYHPADRRELSAWLPVLAAARLDEDIPEEQEQLLAIARAGLPAQV